MQFCSGFLLLAEAAPQQPPPWVNMVPLVLLMVVFYFIIIRPQQKKAKELAALVETLKPGDRVLCNSGIVGSVVSVKDKNVTLRSADSKIEVLKSSVSEILDRGTAAPAS
jgi:preprotein translocase subunit YajC